MRKLAYEIRPAHRGRLPLLPLRDREPAARRARPQPEDHRRRAALPDLQGRPRVAGDRAAAAGLAGQLRPRGRRPRRPRPRTGRRPAPARVPAAADGRARRARRRRAAAARAAPPRPRRAPPPAPAAEQPPAEAPAAEPPSPAPGRVKPQLPPFAARGGRERAAAGLRLRTDQANSREVVISSGSVERQRSRDHREPDPRSRAPQHRQRNERLRACGSRSTRAARTRAATGSTSPTTSTSPSSGAQGENCSTYLSKGRPVAVEGRLDWREWEAKDGSGKRQAVSIIANSVQFLGSRDGGGEANGGRFQAQSDVPADTSDFDSAEPAAVGASDDDIPF